jgi:predicted amidohydrolase YtcJ
VAERLPGLTGADWMEGLHAGQCFSSDWAVSTLNPFEIIETAITRQKRVDDDLRASFFADQALMVEECVQGYTVNAARACWRDHFTGMLQPGYSADLIVLDRDVFTCPPQSISQTRVLFTLFKGHEVYRNPDFPG